MLLVFPRLIREQLLEGDFTVNMRLLQVMEFEGTCPVFSHEADTWRPPMLAAVTGRLGTRKRWQGLRVQTPEEQI